MHDLRSMDELDEVFGKGGAIEAAEQARREGRIRFIGLTGHHDPLVLLEAMRRYPFDNVLCAVNPADPARAPFLSTVVAEARRKGMGVVGMKVMAAGQLLRDRAATASELIRYGATLTDTVIIGCSTVEEVRQNLVESAGFRAMPPSELRALEQRIAPRAERYDSFKG